MPEKVTRREFLRTSLLALAAPGLLVSCAKEAEKRVVNFFNWSKYIGKDTLPRFLRESGVSVNYEEFADEEEMTAKLRSGARGYDLIVAADYQIPRLKASNLIDPIPQGVLFNQGNIDPQFRNTPYDPDNAYSVPYLWGTTGIAYNKNKVPQTPSSWEALWDEKQSGKISMLDNARDCISMALLLKGYPEDTTDERQLEQAKQLLLAQKPLVRQYSSATYIDGLVAGELTLAMAWSGDALQARRENPQIDYVIPREGSFMWADNLCLVRGSRHREDALKLVDYLIRKDVAAEIANTVRYASPNAAARPLLDPALLKDPRVFPLAAVKTRLRFHALLDPDTTQLWNELWSDVKVS
ncbi:MAG: spermidine/putrescine ABC transporter substrate-binding protein [Elusimicrobia bacterium]|nr:spermidine/putrescine ABC transporter substrate-binding protein [Elusimicrobiota bacterium]